MVSSIKEALEQAMKKSSKGKGHPLIHPSFPPQGTEQPAFMGSQSAPPMQGDPMGMSPDGPPIDPSGQFGGSGAY